MTVIMLTGAPASLRGYLKRFMLAVSTGLYAGKVGRRTRDALWERVTRSGCTRAVMLEPAATEQGFAVRTSGDMETMDLDGVTLMATRLDDIDDNEM